MQDVHNDRDSSLMHCYASIVGRLFSIGGLWWWVGCNVCVSVCVATEQTLETLRRTDTRMPT